MASYNKLSEPFHKLFEGWTNGTDEIAKKVAKLMANYYNNAYVMKSWDGAAWPGLSDKYKKLKIKHIGVSEANLIYDGDLYRDFQTGLTNGISYATWKNGIIFTIKNEYAATHNWGNPLKHIPKRQFIGMTSTLEEMITKLIEEEIQKILDKI